MQQNYKYAVNKCHKLDLGIYKGIHERNSDSE